MRKFKLIIPVLLCLCLIPFASFAEGSQATNEGVLTSKEEVIYANLSADGSIEKVYAVNVLNVEKGGAVFDYGDFSSVENLTNADKLSIEGDKVIAVAEPGRYYYRGNMKAAALPWQFKIEYMLNGESVTASELNDKSGDIQIKIKTNQNTEISGGYFENYMMQIQFTLNTEYFTNIKAEGGTLANAGKNKILSFTVMPESNAELTLSAKVSNFSMPFAQITALPFSFSFTMPDTSDITTQISTLTDAINKINNGASELKNGISTISKNTDDLTSGSASIAEALTDLATKGDELVYASGQILSGINKLSQSLVQMPELQASVSALASGFTNFNNGLSEYVGGVKHLASSYSAIDNGISQTVGGIKKLNGGAAALSDGTKALVDNTKDLPQQFKEKIDSLISSYDKSAFEAPSFTSTKNTQTESVQFLIKIG
ncbi:MAG: hypothetical protein DBX47_01785 [Clostridiales bacterium]|nr:MAG: hypothetical protein DBX47_01785 [Clostridiales bacterium]